MRLLAFAPLLSLIITCVFAQSQAGGLYPPGLLPLINRANALLAAGQFAEAARAYTEAIEQSPSDYLLYYKRATAYFSLSRHSSALDDFDQVLTLTSNTFDNAHLMKAKILSKEGRFDEARTSLKLFIAGHKDDETAKELMAAIGDAQKAEKKAIQAKKSQLWAACQEMASQALKTASYSVSLREMRADCALTAGDIEGAVGDFTRLSQVTTPTTTSLLRLFRLAYFYMPPSSTSSSSAAIKHCLHLDPDSKPCLTAHREAKAIEKGFTKLETLMQKSDWKGILTLLLGSGRNNELMNKVDQAVEKYEPESKAVCPRRQIVLRALCKANVQLSKKSEIEKWCTELSAMKGMEEDIDVLVGRGFVAQANEEWQEAVRFFEKAFEASGKSDRDIHQRLVKAQKLLKQSKQKDYYKVLGVARDADQKTIRKAFRKAAMTAHPDKGGSEAKMATVNEAYEVLNNPELRARFDAGDDPNDPESQQGGHPFGGGFGADHPFAQFFQGGGSQFGGGFPGGGNFKFNFHHP